MIVDTRPGKEVCCPSTDESRHQQQATRLDGMPFDDVRERLPVPVRRAAREASRLKRVCNPWEMYRAVQGRVPFSSIISACTIIAIGTAGRETLEPVRTLRVKIEIGLGESTVCPVLSTPSWRSYH